MSFMLQKLLALAALLTLSQSLVLAGTVTTYPSTWDVSHAGTPLAGSVRAAKPAFDEQFQTLSIGAEQAKDVTWYAPIHYKLGVGKLADPTDRQSIALDNNALQLQTRNPNEPGGVDVNIQTMDKHGNGFAMQNGYFEVNASLPVAHGSHCGIWLLSQPGEQGHGEIDIVEAYGMTDRHIHSSLHWWPNLKASRFAGHVFIGRGFFDPGVVFQGSFHDYGAQLTPTEVIFYFDQKETRRAARLPEQTVPFYLLLSVFTDGKRKDGYEPATMRVARVRAWTAPVSTESK
jgi:hypothetical protein